MFIVSNSVYRIMFFHLLHNDFLVITSTKNSKLSCGHEKSGHTKSKYIQDTKWEKVTLTLKYVLNLLILLNLYKNAMSLLIGKFYINIYTVYDY